MKKLCVFLGKLVISGICAVVVLSLFSMVYYNPPVHAPQPQKYTNSKFVPNTFWSCMTEGFGFGKTNDLGYLDSESFNPEKPAIAFLGSSHTEAVEVPQSANYVEQFQALLNESGQEDSFQCLNFGVSGHFFNVSASNFEYFAESVPNVKRVVIEVGSLRFSDEELYNMLEGKYHSDLAPRGKLQTLAQKIPYFRLLYKQYQDTRQAPAAKSSGDNVDFHYESYAQGIDKVMKKLSAIASEKDMELLILYHNSFIVKDGRASRKDDLKIRDIFRGACEQNDIGFLDVTDHFVDHFNQTYELPYGFSNTTPGTGHLNKLGHRMIAEELYTYMTE